MCRLRISLAGLMIIVVFAAVGIAALRNASETWAGVMLLATQGLLAASALGIVYRRDGRRAWWLGFALFGSGYLALAFVPGVRPKLPTTELLGYAHSRLFEAPAGAGTFHLTSAGSGRVRLASDSDGSVIEAGEIRFARDRIETFGTVSGFYWTGAPEPFLDVGHSLFALLAGLVGGLTARWFHATGGRSDQGSR